MIKYTDQHEWIKVLEDNVGIVGITDHAQHQLGDIVFVELPVLGKKIAAKQEAAVVESVKAASEVYTPVSGEIMEVNDMLSQSPDLVNTSPEQNGWFFKIKLSNPQELDSLMNEAEYHEYLDKECC